ncbi:uncharacterized protein LOC126657005 [Mercurialis annua]|uniref:uncharacterized protein LOC126657005 n=1 Tax=Mercurialis annua TaxID=3986 RepID=UPI0021600CD3|nr:uncharacterized protein LOC126657005 [Mercurialis annua]
MSVLKTLGESDGPTIKECNMKLDEMITLTVDDPLNLIACTIFYENKAYQEQWLVLSKKSEDGVVGALDGTLIRVSIPPAQQTPYRGRGRGDCYQNVLAICDFDMLFTFVWDGWEGAAHDSRVLIETMRDPSNNFPFPPPEIFNHAHAKLRNVVERSFGILKARFPILKIMPSYPINVQRNIIIACVAVHNYLRRMKVMDEFFEQFDRTEMIFQQPHANIMHDGT